MLRHFFIQIGLVLILIGNAAHADEPVILVLGDSLSAGYGIELDQGWVSLLQQQLTDQGYPHKVVNASISGDTSRGGLSRLPTALERHQPSIVIIELGGNDGLRGLSLNQLETNLAEMTELSQQAGADVVLVEMRIPPNYGPRYTERFQALYGDLAERYNAALVPFLLDRVAEVPGLMQSDQIHPNAKAQPIILENVWPALEPLLEQTVTASAS